MLKIEISQNKHQFPNWKVEAVATRERDLVIRIADWTDLPKDCSKGEPSYDVEVYVGGVYSYIESECFSLNMYPSKEVAKQRAIEFAQRQILIMLEGEE